LVKCKNTLPFDINGIVLESIQKQSRIYLLLKMLGGATAFRYLDQVLNNQEEKFQLDSEPKTLAAKAHRPAYGSDGDYFSKPSQEDIIDAIYSIMNEADPIPFNLLNG
jgi:hypothetical protein